MFSRVFEICAAVRGGRLLAVGAACCLVLLAIRWWPHPSLRASVPSSSAVYARDGELLRIGLAADEQYRVWVALSDIDPRLVQAVQLYEDRWFYWHPGVNPIALARAATLTYGGGPRQGASTISMQFARRLYDLRSQSVSGKLRQLAAALWLEARYSKHDILEAYLNLAPYGGNIEGAGAASLIYFHKRARQLTLPEVLTLAVILQNPRKRSAMSGRGFMQQELAAARYRLWRTWLETHPEAIRYESRIRAPVRFFSSAQLPFLAPHLTDRLMREGRAGEIWSSLDLRLQQTAERIVTQFVENHRGQGISNATAILPDRDTGEVPALVGSADYFSEAIDGQVNGILARRSPGSTLKPFIYGLALDQGLLHPMTILKDAPTTFGPFSPENFDGRYVLAVWVGNFDGSGNPACVGIKAAAPLFFKIVDSVRGQHFDPGEPAWPTPANAVRIEVGI